MKFSCLLLVLLIACSSGVTASLEKKQPSVEEGVYVLTSSTFEEFLSQNEFVLVEFYAPWCGHCQKLAPVYSAAAEEMAVLNPSVKLAKVDATVEESLAERFSVEGYPTIKLFSRERQNPIDYNRGHSVEEIVGFLQKRSSNWSKQIETLEELKHFNDQHKVTVIYFGKLKNNLHSKMNGQC